MIGEGDVNGNANALLNMMKWGGSVSLPSGTTTSLATVTTANGYPAGPVTTATSYTYSLGQFPIPRYGETQVTRWTGKGGGIFGNTGMTFTIVSATPSVGACIFGGVGPFTDQIKFSGTSDCYVRWSASPTAGANPASFGMTWAFSNSFGQITAYDGTMANLEIYPLKYETQRDAGEIFDPDYISMMRSLNTNILRTMDWERPNFSNVTSNAFKMPVASVAYNAQLYPANLWGGDTSGSSAFSVGAAPSTPVSYTDGETITVRFTAAAPASTATTGAVNSGGAIQITVASTAGFSGGQRIAYSGYASSNGTGFGVGYYTVQIDTGTQITLVGSVWPAQTYASGGTVSTVTIDIGARGSKLLVNSGSGPISSSSWGSAAAGSLSTLVYDGWLDVVYVTNSSPTSGAITGGGLVAGWPIEIIVALANKLHVNLWYNFPLNYDDASATASAQYVRDNLSSDLTGYFEVSNEVWNFLFPQTLQAQMRGLYLGFPYSSGRSEGGYIGYRVRTVGALARSAWSPRALSTLQMVNALPANSPAQNTTADNQLNGRDLASVALGGSGNANWIAKTGGGAGANYTLASGTPPVDYSDVLSYATYWNGPAIGVGSSSAGGLAITLNAKEKAAFQTAVNSFNAGNLNDGYAWFDNDLRQGTTSTKDVASTSGGDTFNITSHGYSSGAGVVLTTTGTLPTGLSLGTPYLVIPVNANSFKLGTVAAPSTPVTFTGGSGTISVGLLGGSTLLWLNQFVYAYNPLGGSNPGYESVAASYDSRRSGAGQSPLHVIPYEGGYQGQAPTLGQYTTNGLTVSTTVTFNTGTSRVNWTAQPFHNGDLVKFTGGVLPSGILSGTSYYIMNAGTDDFQLSASYNMSVAPFAITLGGSPSGTTTGEGSPYSINVMMEGWKNSATWGGQFVTDTYNLFKNIPPGSATNHSTIYGWFALQGFSQWSLMPGNSFSAPYSGFNSLSTINR